jgi:hypothetical protein
MRKSSASVSALAPLTRRGRAIAHTEAVLIARRPRRGAVARRSRWQTAQSRFRIEQISTSPRHGCARTPFQWLVPWLPDRSPRWCQQTAARPALAPPAPAPQRVRGQTLRLGVAVQETTDAVMHRFPSQALGWSWGYSCLTEGHIACGSLYCSYTVSASHAFALFTSVVEWIQWSVEKIGLPRRS